MSEVLCWGLKNRNKRSKPLRCCKGSNPFSISLITSSAPKGTTGPTEPTTGMESEQGTRNFQYQGVSLSPSVSGRTQQPHAERGRAPRSSPRRVDLRSNHRQSAQYPARPGWRDGRRSRSSIPGRAGRAPSGTERSPGTPLSWTPPLRLPAHTFLPSPPPGPTAARPFCARPPPKASTATAASDKGKAGSPH